jgi:hypothetical protein
MTAFRVRSGLIASAVKQQCSEVSFQVDGIILKGNSGRPQQDSNLRTRLRRPVLYPLSYGGPMTSKGYQPRGIVWDTDRTDLGMTLPDTVASPRGASVGTSARCGRR